MNSGFMGNFSKMMGDKKVFLDPYVQITFAGQQVFFFVLSHFFKQVVLCLSYLNVHLWCLNSQMLLTKSFSSL